MTQVNLLPWREEARQVKKIRFFILLGMGIGIAIVAIVILHIFIANLISSQQSVNTILEEQLNLEKSSIVHLKKQKTEKEKIVSQLQFGYSLQNQNFKVVSLFNVLVNTIPEGVTLTKIAREGNKITLVGKTQSTLGVTAFMNNIEKTNQFDQPILTRIAGDQKKDEKSSGQDLFQIEVVQKE